MALVTHTVTQPLDLAKTRIQILQEGKNYHGIGFRKGFHMMQVMEETYRAGGGMKKFYSSYDAFFARTVSYTTARIWGFLYFYDWINPDARRQARPDFYAYAGIAGGLVGGFLANPFQIVFSRMQVDEMYPERARRNYKGFLDGFVKVAEEGALFRGSLAHGLKFAGLVSVGSGCYDWVKENLFYFFGPISALRLIGTAAGVAAAMAVSMPFDAVATRLHTMRPLPNGELPYNNTLDCMGKMMKYECSFDHYSNLGAFYSGGQAYFARYYLIAIVTQYMLDYYHGTAKVSEFWQPARYQYQTGIDYDIHNPFTDGFYKQMAYKWSQEGNEQPFLPSAQDGKGKFAFV